MAESVQSGGFGVVVIRVKVKSKSLPIVVYRYVKDKMSISLVIHSTTCKFDKYTFAVCWL